MTPRARFAASSVLALLAAVVAANAIAADTPAAPESSVSATGYYYSMRDQPDFGVGVAALNRGSLRLEARYNYEAHDTGSAFVGWKFAGGETVTFEVTPIVGALFGAGRGVVPGVEASLGWGAFDAYVEAEYVRNRAEDAPGYYYAWSELGWRPVHWLRVGLAGQRTRTVDNGQEFQRGVFAQATIAKATLGVYAFNPDSGSRYLIFSLGAQF